MIAKRRLQHGDKVRITEGRHTGWVGTFVEPRLQPAGLTGLVQVILDENVVFEYRKNVEVIDDEDE